MRGVETQGPASSGKFRHKVVDNTPAGFKALDDWLAKEGATALQVCMEATGTYWEAVAEYLAGRTETTVSVVNPVQIKAFGASRMMRTKTDKVDAKLIAQFCAERTPVPWQAPTPAEKNLRALVLRLDALQSMRTQESNRLEVARDSVAEGITKHLKWLDDEIARLGKAIRDHIDNDPTLKDKHHLLDSIPGLGERTTAVLLAFLAEPARFENARQVVAFAGLDPRRPRPAPARVGQQRARQAPALQGRPQLSAQGPLHARHGRPLPNRLGQALPRTPRRQGQTPDAHHRRHDAQAPPRQLRRAQVGPDIPAGAPRGLTGITVSTSRLPRIASSPSPDPPLFGGGRKHSPPPCAAYPSTKPSPPWPWR